MEQNMIQLEISLILSVLPCCYLYLSRVHLSARALAILIDALGCAFKSERIRQACDIGWYNSYGAAIAHQLS